MEEIRINKYLASLGVASRREIDRYIEEGRVSVNGVKINQGVKVTAKDKILIDGKPVKVEKTKKVYYMLNKPSGVLSTAKDDRGRKTVVDIVKSSERIFPIGRLDMDTEGLILLTNDGELFNRLMHPKAEIYKEYNVVAKYEIKDKDIHQLKIGVKLEDGKTLPARVRILKRDGGKTYLKIAIREGRNRQIRRMLEAIGHPVVSLTREKIADLELGQLKVGEYRELTPKEVRYLYSL
jgi:23S rRNA pseudouridine2605 synthase